MKEKEKKETSPKSEASHLATREENHQLESQTLKIRMLHDRLKQGVTKFAYEKVDGTRREALGIWKESPLQKESMIEEGNKIYCYFDLEAQNFRSFRIENLLEIY